MIKLTIQQLGKRCITVNKAVTTLKSIEKRREVQWLTKLQVRLSDGLEEIFQRTIIEGNENF